MSTITISLEVPDGKVVEIIDAITDRLDFPNSAKDGQTRGDFLREYVKDHLRGLFKQQQIDKVARQAKDDEIARIDTDIPFT